MPALRRIVFVLICIFLVAGCRTGKYTQTNIYFGRLISDTGFVSDKQWQTFVSGYIVPVLANGFTVTENKGYWYDPDLKKLIAEPSFMITSVGKLTPFFSARIDSICYWYKTLYRQQAVLRVDRRVKASF